MRTRERLYEVALRGARPLLRAAAPFNGKLGRGLAGRRGAVAGLEAWASTSRDAARPLVWLHAPSVGEGLMAQAILRALRDAAPDAQYAFTYFSPSAERLAPGVGADVAGYLPWDVRADVGRVLDALRPSVIAFVRTEIWPVLGAEAARRGVALALVNAVLSRGSSRLRAGSRFLLGPAYRRLHAVGAVARADADRFTLLGVARDRLHITGDARFDQVWARVGRLRTRASPVIGDATAVHAGDATSAIGSLSTAAADAPPDGTSRDDEARPVADADVNADAGPGAGPDANADADTEAAAGPVGDRHPLLTRLADRAVTTLVAGSTWPADEARLVPAFARIREHVPFRLIVAPHEPGAAHLTGLERALDRAGVPHARLADVEHPDGPLPDAVIVDRLGILADLYAIADVAYVGGGFHRHGLHSVVEPAALGVPVLFGPRYGNAREADALAWAGGGSVVRDSDQCASLLVRLARDADARAEAGRAALGFVRSNLGGAEANARLILELAAR